ncbi:MAG: NAD(P)/FAD-dependent oxidoreductase [Nanoarchaeota archaeon]|nr:NAD(P)/FAD-dependent oxidoreductase [Nanoarchaeota archaeon]
MISIIGAGPAGSYLASLLAKEETAVFEEHETIGTPVQCTGITTQALAEIIQIKKEFLINKINQIKIISPNKDSIQVKLKKPNLIIDRTKFDQHLVEKAQDEGVRFYTGYKYKDCKEENGKIRINFENGKKIETDILVGADGPFSKVAKTTEMWQERKYAIGAQVRAKIETDPETTETHVGQGYFGWVVPEDNKTARIGIATQNNPKEVFRNFLKKIKPEKVIENQSGLIPIYNPKQKTQKGNVYLVGDAATQVKATTSGGIIQGMMAAEELSKAIKQNKNYERLWKKRIGKDLWLSLMIRKKLDKLHDKKYNKLINMFNKDKLRQIIETHDRDYPSKFIFKLLLKEPRLLSFIF